MADAILTAAIDRLAGGHDLSADDAAAVLHVMMAGEASEAQAAAFLIALRTKGETVQEITGLARAMRELAPPWRRARPRDTAGTGGGPPTFNVSTAAALVAAGAGCTVAKHGNRSATGRCGSADVLEALGARIDLEPGRVGDCIRDVGFGFMFAPLHHQATRHVVPVRSTRGSHDFQPPRAADEPRRGARQVIGVSDPGIWRRWRRLGGLARRGLVVSSADGLDELWVSAPTRVVELRAAE